MRFLISFILFVSGYIMMNRLNALIDYLLKVDKKTNDILFNIMGGCFMLSCFHQFGLSFTTFVVLLIVFNLLVIAKIDYLTMNIYLLSILLFMILTIGYCMIQHRCLQDMMYGAISVASMMLFFNVIIPESFGFGDIELMFVSGILLGFQNNILAMIIAICIAGTLSCLALFFHKISLKTQFPFAPYLTLGILLSLFYGQQLLDWYFMI